ncbi:MAG: hypothetical protein ACJAUG_002094 [Halioglobus sp.]|jgi:hypothetical protein
MKKLTLYGLALLLIASTSTAFAGDADNRRHDKHNKYDRHASKHERQYNKHDRHYNSRFNSHYNSHYNRHYSHNGFRKHRGYRSHHGFREFHGGNYYRSSYYPSAYLGAALIGSAISYNRYHQHNGASCYDDHSNDSRQSSNRNYSEIVGCHRIERLADGSERRVEVPRAQCQ